MYNLENVIRFASLIGFSSSIPFSVEQISHAILSVFFFPFISNSMSAQFRITLMQWSEKCSFAKNYIMYAIDHSLQCRWLRQRFCFRHSIPLQWLSRQLFLFLMSRLHLSYRKTHFFAELSLDQVNIQSKLIMQTIYLSQTDISSVITLVFFFSLFELMKIIYAIFSLTFQFQKVLSLVYIQQIC